MKTGAWTNPRTFFRSSNGGNNDDGVRGVGKKQQKKREKKVGKTYTILQLERWGLVSWFSARAKASRNELYMYFVWNSMTTWSTPPHIPTTHQVNRKTATEKGWWCVQRINSWCIQVPTRAPLLIVTEMRLEIGLGQRGWYEKIEGHFRVPPAVGLLNTGTGMGVEGRHR